MRRSTYDNSYNRNRVRIDGRDSGNWASRIGVRSQHKDMRGRVIGGIASDGTAFGTKERQPVRQLVATEAPAPISKPAPAAASPKPAPLPTGIQASIPKANPLGAKLFPDRSKPTPENKLTPQIATNTPGARTSNINRLTGKPMGWRPGDDAPDAAVAAKPATPKTSIEPMSPPAPAKQAPAWTGKASPVAPSPTKMATPADRMPTPSPTKMATPAISSQPAPAAKPATPAWTQKANAPSTTSGINVRFKPDEASAFAQREAARTTKDQATRQAIAKPIMAKTESKIASINSTPTVSTPGFEGSLLEKAAQGYQSATKGFQATLAKQQAQRDIQEGIRREKAKPTGSTWGNSFGNSFGK